MGEKWKAIIISHHIVPFFGALRYATRYVMGSLFVLSYVCRFVSIIVSSTPSFDEAFKLWMLGGMEVGTPPSLSLM